MRLAITQRVEILPGHGERRDCLDQRWGQWMETLGIDLVPVPNGLAAPTEWLKRQHVDGLILSGGNDLSYLPGATNASVERDSTETSLLHWARAQRMAVLGVCRGMQMLNHFLGGTLSPVQGHAGCTHDVSSLNNDALFRAYVSVNSFHNWGIGATDLAQSLTARVQAHDGSIEAAVHHQLPWIGIMWHPERPSANAEHDVLLIHHLFSNKDTPCA